MNRTDLQQLAQVRLEEARVLLANRRYAGAYYLSGYVIECALKACIARRTRRHDFPDKNAVNQSHTHDLNQLIKAAGLEARLRQAMGADPNFETNWAVVKDWSETSRYRRSSARKAQDLFAAITNPRYGVLRWIRRRW